MDRNLFPYAIKHLNEALNQTVENFTSIKASDRSAQLATFILYKAIAYRMVTVEIGEAFGVAFLILGIIAIFLNVVVLLVITARQQCTCSNVFYLLLINFAIIDCIKGFCLLINAFRTIEPAQNANSGMIAGYKLDQIITLILRFCNLKTVLNLIILTLNELLFIRFPLRYNDIVTRKTAICSISFNWIICFILTVISTLFRAKTQYVFVRLDHNDTNFSHNFTLKRLEEWQQSQEMRIHYIISFILTGFCVVCLIVVTISYASFFRVVNSIRIKDARLAQSANRRPSEISICSSLLPNENVLRPKTNRKAVPGVQQREINAYENQELVILDDRRLKRHLLKRYKYVIVLGLVIFVYMLYLIPYSTIQIIQYVTLSQSRSKQHINLISERKTHVIRWDQGIPFRIGQLYNTLREIFHESIYIRDWPQTQHFFRGSQKNDDQCKNFQSNLKPSTAKEKSASSSSGKRISFAEIELINGCNSSAL
uniref:G-protein coupled receptors family 1 profile domain-containing protein n=1 Tax=Romanomermis culicivorax TaxID=13658 RepID=A0A915KQH0_ROMCU